MALSNGGSYLPVLNVANDIVVGSFLNNKRNGKNAIGIIANRKKVFSKENRAVIFDGHQKHCGIDCTDQKIRVVINFNYFLK